jgi:hypothetical protein
MESSIAKIGRYSAEDIFLGGDQTREVLKKIALVMATLERRGKSTDLSDETRVSMNAAVKAVADMLLPLPAALGDLDKADMSDPDTAAILSAWTSGQSIGRILAASDPAAEYRRIVSGTTNTDESA